ncbi:MAG: hypothetical protein ACKPER_07090, partial [Dolichospermum sp.]
MSAPQEFHDSTLTPLTSAKTLYSHKTHRGGLKTLTGVSALMRYILSPLSKSGEGVGGGVTLYLITSVSA